MDSSLLERLLQHGESQTVEFKIAAPRQPERQELALQHIKRYGYITNKRYRELSGISKATAYRDLDGLVKQGIVKETGEKRARRYMIL